MKPRRVCRQRPFGFERFCADVALVRNEIGGVLRFGVSLERCDRREFAGAQQAEEIEIVVGAPIGIV